MPIPGYVIPGQIICPVFERIGAESKPVNPVVRKYVAGHGVSVSQLANDVVALTATLMGRIIVEQINGDASNGSSSTIANNHANQANTSSSTRGLRKSITGNIHTFKVSVQDQFISPSAFTQLPENTESAQLSVTRPSTSVLPDVGTTVLARVTKLSLKQANVQILSVGQMSTQPTNSNTTISSEQITNDNIPASAESGFGIYGPVKGVVPFAQVTSGASGMVNATDVGEGFGGIVRAQDVRLTERDKVKILDCFKPGDIIRASVVSPILV